MHHMDFFFFVAGDDRNVQLKNLDYAAEKLKLFKADLLDYNSVLAAIDGCDGVFHVASPVPRGSVPNPEARFSNSLLDIKK